MHVESRLIRSTLHVKGDIGVFHTHRDAEFNLLFHASIEDNLPAVKVRKGLWNIFSLKCTRIFQKILPVVFTLR